MVRRRFDAVLGGATGLVTLLAMLRLILGGLGANKVPAAVVVIVVMLGWLLYAGWRADRAELGHRAKIALGVLLLAGLSLVWWGTLGPVIGLVCSFAGFVIIWRHDRPRRPSRRRHRFRIDEVG